MVRLNMPVGLRRGSLAVNFSKTHETMIINIISSNSNGNSIPILAPYKPL